MKMYNIIIRGGGDTATAIAWYLFKANFRNLIILEKEKPTSIRREVCFSSAIYEGEKIVEGIKAVKCNKDIDFDYRDFIPVIIDEKGELLNKKNVDIVIDAILSKRKRRNYDLKKFYVVGLGPEFEPEKNCHVAIETYRGHNLGKIYFKGKPESPTGTPGEIAGYSEERLLRSPCDGIIRLKKDIGEIVEKGDVVAFVNEMPVRAKINGIIRGLIHSEIYVHKNQKIGDIDPRMVKDYCYTISDRSRCIAGAVLLAILNKSG